MLNILSIIEIETHIFLKTEDKMLSLNSFRYMNSIILSKEKRMLSLLLFKIFIIRCQS